MTVVMVGVVRVRGGSVVVVEERRRVGLGRLCLIGWLSSVKGEEVGRDRGNIRGVGLVGRVGCRCWWRRRWWLKGVLWDQRRSSEVR